MLKKCGQRGRKKLKSKRGDAERVLVVGSWAILEPMVVGKNLTEQDQDQIKPPSKYTNYCN